jgi:perosamine synthetase
MANNARSLLAINGGTPIRRSTLPYGRQSISDDDVQAVVNVLRSHWLTTGPAIGDFEDSLAQALGAPEAIAVSSGTAALHAAMNAIGIGPGDEVIVPAMTFAASANAVLYQGGTPVFADVFSETLLVDPASVEAKLSTRTRAIVAVDYAGQPCDYTALRALAAQHGVPLIADACHAIGGAWCGQPVGNLADLSCFSFHPVKHITTGEGGAVSTANPDLARRMRVFRNHGITSDHRQRELTGSWFYEMTDLGYNYRMTDIQAALGRVQLSKLSAWVARRQAIASTYDRYFSDLPAVTPLAVHRDASHAYHLYVVRLEDEHLCVGRGEVYQALRAEGIGVNVHYVPVHLHPYYRTHLGTVPGICPNAEAAYERILSLPMFPDMSDTDIEHVMAAISKVTTAYAA